MKIKPSAFILFFFFLVLIFAATGCSRGNVPQPADPTQTVEAAPTSTEAAQPTTEPEPTSVVVELPTGLIREPVPESALETVRFLMEAEHQPTDYYRLAQELLGMDPADLTVEPVGEYRVNDRMDFFINENPASPVLRYKTQPARLRHISEHVAWWAGIDVRVDDRDIEALAQRFEEQVMPLDQQLFGKEWSPGIDGDERIHFLLIQDEMWGGFFGYFSDINEYPRAIFPHSNEREMLVINVSSAIDTDPFASKLAHEYQHLIQWNQDPNEDLWFNEAMGELVTQAGGSVFGESNEIHYAQNPHIQLTSRPERAFGEEDKAAFAHYAAERQFAVYLLEQFGAQFINSLVHNPDPGVIGIQAELAELEGSPTFKDVFANWLVANFLDMPEVAEGQFGYQNLDIISPVARVVDASSTDSVQDRLSPYGAHYYQINSAEPVKITFNGSTLTRLAPKDPAEGSYVWYSNRGDNSTFSLTRSFDLSDVDQATLNYKVWYELDNTFDYAYVEISTDGETWTILEPAHGTSQDPNQRAYGIGYTGSSTDWVDESIDLTPYVGQTVQIRFEVINDFTINRDGLQLDNIEIPEIGFFDGAEDDQAGWEAQGFIRSTNLVPVEWIVWAIAPGPSIERVPVSAGQSATYEYTGFGTQYDFALLVIAPTAPASTMEIDYEFILEH